jgi:hypothetical protein
MRTVKAVIEFAKSTDRANTARYLENEGQGTIEMERLEMQQRVLVEVHTE